MTVALAIIGAVTKVVGGIISGVQAAKEQKAHKVTALENAQISMRNVQIMRENARLTADKMKRALVANQQETNLETGEIRAQGGALGVTGGSGLDLVAAAMTQSIFRATDIIQTKESERTNYLLQAENYKGQARAFQASAAAASPGLAMLGGLVGGLGDAAVSLRGRIKPGTVIT